MKQYIIYDTIFDNYYMDCGDWTIYKSCAQKYNTEKEAKKVMHYIIALNKPIKLKELKLIEVKGE